MARKRVTLAITDLDNIPAEAVVPGDEQPYEIPTHWKWVRLGAVLREMKTRKPSGEAFTYLDIDSVNNELQEIREPKHVQTSKAPSRASRAVRSGATIVSMVRPYLRNVALIDADLSEAIASTGFYVCDPLDLVDSVFLFEYLRSEVFIDLMTTKMRGDNSPSIRADDLREAVFPLPPIDEQKAIVEKLQATNQKIDDVLERLDQFLEESPRKQFALVQALLAGYGATNYEAYRSKAWKREPLGRIIRVSSGKGLTAKEMHPEGSVPVYGGNGVTGYHDEACYPAGTIAIGRVGYYCGAVHMSKEECWVTDNALVARFDDEEIDREFLYHLLAHTNLRVNTSSSAQPLISGKKIYDIEVQVPQLDVQKSIAADIKRTVGRLVSAESAVKQARELLLSTRSVVRQQALRGIS